MDFKSQAIVLHQFLNETKAMWEDEVMNKYPHSLEIYPENWINDLKKLSLYELFLLDSKQSFSSLQNDSFKQFLEKIQKLSLIDHITKVPLPPLEDWAYLDVKYKKKHEIEKLAPTIINIFKENQISHINDIGGGVGHLSRILAHYYGIPMNSIDQDQNLQKIGLIRTNKFRKLSNASAINFINQKLEETNSTDTLFTHNSFSLGLHTCGDLALQLIKKNVKNKTIGLLSFGCCYFKVGPKHDLRLSYFFKENNLININLYGLTLASRAHTDTNFKNFETRYQVKKYRYALHLFLIKYFNRFSDTAVGESSLKIYQEPISKYFLLKLKELEITHSFLESDIEAFFHSEATQITLKEMFLCDMIRFQLGRVIEKYILLDRCVYMEENGYIVKLEQYFNEALSPRNIGILALLKK